MRLLEAAGMSPLGIDFIKRWRILGLRCVTCIRFEIFEKECVVQLFTFSTPSLKQLREPMDREGVGSWSKAWPYTQSIEQSFSYASGQQLQNLEVQIHQESFTGSFRGQRPEASVQTPSPPNFERVQIGRSVVRASHVSHDGYFQDCYITIYTDVLYEVTRTGSLFDFMSQFPLSGALLVYLSLRRSVETMKLWAFHMLKMIQYVQQWKEQESVL